MPTFPTHLSTCSLRLDSPLLPLQVEALSDMPPRADEELDPVSLHNTGLMRMETEPASGFRKLNFLISNPPFPPGEEGPHPARPAV
jgi:hypothetical protein